MTLGLAAGTGTALAHTWIDTVVSDAGFVVGAFAVALTLTLEREFEKTSVK
jgi:hypothetical protein